jgi:hypothetical protein
MFCDVITTISSAPEKHAVRTRQFSKVKAATEVSDLRLFVNGLGISALYF